VANPAAGGTVTGGGTYDYGTVVTVTATPAANYTSSTGRRRGGSNSASTTTTVDGDKTVTANFALDQYTLTSVANRWPVAR